ncbi:MAG TPA: response regulator transcription factor, partial [Bacillota bacterium]|nr:response regulator transcription factor [Bacillota bacterium]
MDKPTILVVDDDPKITALLKRALTFEGYEVSVAHDGLEGLKSVWSEPPDLVILDLMMPGLDGLGVCRRLRSEGDIPILMLTARDELSDRVEGLDAGADDYLVKPFALEELAARVRALLRRPRKREGSQADRAGASASAGTGVGGAAGAGTGAVVRTGREAARNQLAYEDLTLDLGTREASRGDRVIMLTTKEFELLSLFLANPRQVLTRELIMDKVWGYDFSGESNVL